jgi:hypothetical protein
VKDGGSAMQKFLLYEFGQDLGNKIYDLQKKKLLMDQ